MTLFEEADAKLLPGFERRFIETADGEILALVAGEGPPLPMLRANPDQSIRSKRKAMS